MQMYSLMEMIYNVSEGNEHVWRGVTEVQYSSCCLTPFLNKVSFRDLQSNKRWR